MLEKFYGVFKNHVAQARNIDINEIEGIGARLFDTGTALDMGLIDGVMHWKAVREQLAKSIGRDADSCNFVSVRPGSRNKIQNMFSELFAACAFSLGINPQAVAVRSLKNSPALFLWDGYEM